jgi:hypothetical protein
MSDHYFDRRTLESMGASVRDGRLPRLDPATREQFVTVLRGSGSLKKIQKTQGTLAALAASDADQAADKQPMKKPWWKFW